MSLRIFVLEKKYVVKEKKSPNSLDDEISPTKIHCRRQFTEVQGSRGVGRNSDLFSEIIDSKDRRNSVMITTQLGRRPRQLHTVTINRRLPYGFDHCTK